MAFEYTIAAIPTVYNHVQFRSRLEARWAAFFDLAGIKWDYEPFDLDGWAPDFLLKTVVGQILVEVKPVDTSEKAAWAAFEKAEPYWSKYQLLLLGVGPIEKRDLLGIIADPPDESKYDWCDVMDALLVADPIPLWREAGNIVQWKSPSMEAESTTVAEIMRRAKMRKAA
jgi:hypothetical protein